MNRVLIATADLAYEQRIRKAFNGELNGELERWLDADLLVGDPDRTMQELVGFGSEVVVFGPDVPIDDALAVAKQFDLRHPGISVIITAEPTPKILQQALHVGVRGVLSPKASFSDVRKELQRAAAVADEHRANRPPTTVAGRRPSGQVITVLAPKGGSGKTLIASNLAVGLARVHPGEVVLVDLDLQFGDITNALNLIPQHGMGDLAQSVGEIDSATIKVILTPRGDDLFVLCAPDAPAQGEEITADRVERVLRQLAADFRYVVVDTAAGLTEHTLSALEVATDLVLVCDLAVASVRGLRKVIGALDQLDMTNQMRHVVLNRADSNVGLNPSEVPGTLGHRIDLKLSSSRAVPLSMNQGTPIIEASPRSPVAKQLGELVGRFAEVPVAKRGRRS
ncbi:MAG: AAA family ATPase [Acidimicrobiia bacterium]|nr:AAA family ATPase [Acidimicrobiia bacterium]